MLGSARWSRSGDARVRQHEAVNGPEHEREPRPLDFAWQAFASTRQVADTTSVLLALLWYLAPNQAARAGLQTVRAVLRGLPRSSSQGYVLSAEKGRGLLGDLGGQVAATKLAIRGGGWSQDGLTQDWLVPCRRTLACPGGSWLFV